MLDRVLILQFLISKVTEYTFPKELELSFNELSIFYSEKFIPFVYRDDFQTSAERKLSARTKTVSLNSLHL